MSKKGFLAHKRSKLELKRDSSFKVLERINDNAYKIDLSCEYSVNIIFNVYDPFLFDVGDDSSLNHFKKRRNDDNQQTPQKDPLKVSIGQITRSRARRLKWHSMGLFKIFRLHQTSIFQKVMSKS